MNERIVVEVELFQEDGHIVSVCPRLNVSSFGESPEEALNGIQEALTLFLEECQRTDSLEEVLEEAGYCSEEAQGQRSWLPPKAIARKSLVLELA